jgi:hypothetical protein
MVEHDDAGRPTPGDPREPTNEAFRVVGLPGRRPHMEGLSQDVETQAKDRKGAGMIKDVPLPGSSSTTGKPRWTSTRTSSGSS